MDQVEPTIYPASQEDREPCCAITEGGWTWFGSLLLTLTLFALFHLKYKKKVISRPKNLKKPKNEVVLKGYLLAQQKAARTDMPEGNLSVAEFEKCCEDRRKYPIIFKIEFGTVNTSASRDPLSQSIATNSLQTNKNRTGNILPSDSNRVVLRGREGPADYINASHVPGLVSGLDYIVTQGPLDTTVTDFWSMVWQQNCPGIVMLTKTFDYIRSVDVNDCIFFLTCFNSLSYRVMSVQYWPGGPKEELYGEVAVKLVEERRYASFVQRTFRVRRGEERQREITHLQFTEWPCYSSPHSGALLRFRQRVAQLLGGSRLKGPTVVHCHDGGGRSGVYLMLDANINLIQSSGQVNIFSFLTEIKRNRPGLVANQEQYRLVYSLLEEFVILGDTELSVSEFLGVAEEKVREEYEQLERVRPELSQGDCAGGHRVENRKKNRSVLVLPPDKHRPYITSFQGNDCTDYINAVFVDGFSNLNEFIVTEWPLSNTVQNFWSMLYDHDVVTVVVMDCPKHSAKYPGFWPEFDKPRKYGPVFSVEQVKLEAEIDFNKDLSEAEIENAELIDKKDGFISIRVNISKKEVAPHRKTQALLVDDKAGKQFSTLTNLVVGVTVPPQRCRIFQVTSEHCSPTVLKEMMAAAKRWRNSEKPDSPTVVVSLDGARKAGVYCAASQCWDQLVRDHRVDTAGAVRSVRISRPHLLNRLEEYREVREIVRNVLTAS